MRNQIVLLLACCCLLLAGAVKAQTERVKVKFEEDGKEVDDEFKLLFYVNGKEFKPTLLEKSFVVPPELGNYETVDVRFQSGAYDLFFESVYLTKFKTDWAVGVDNPPFDKDNTASDEPTPPDRELRILYYIDFTPKSKGDGTRMVVKVYK